MARTQQQQSDIDQAQGRLDGIQEALECLMRTMRDDDLALLLIERRNMARTELCYFIEQANAQAVA
jgi:hypothetical protein